MSRWVLTIKDVGSYSRCWRDHCYKIVGEDEFYWTIFLPSHEPHLPNKQFLLKKDCEEISEEEALWRGALR